MEFQFLLNHETGTGSISGLATFALCLAVSVPLLLIAMWYWSQYYYVREGLRAGVLAGMAAFLINGLAIIAMMLSVIERTVFRRDEKTGPCPNCGRRKMISNRRYPAPHQIQPHCPHCRQMVLQYRFLTQDEWREQGFK